MLHFEKINTAKTKNKYFFILNEFRFNLLKFRIIKSKNNNLTDAKERIKNNLEPGAISI